MYILVYAVYINVSSKLVKKPILWRFFVFGDTEKNNINYDYEKGDSDSTVSTIVLLR